MINYQQLYLMRDLVRSTYVRPEVDPSDKTTTDSHLTFLRGQDKPSRPVSLCNRQRRKLSDILWGTSSSLVLLSASFAQALTEGGCTGWSTYDVEIKDSTGVITEIYYGLTVTGRTGSRDFSRSVIVERPAPASSSARNTYIKGFYFLEDTFDGKDFSLSGETTYIIVSQKVVNISKRFSHANTKFVPLTDVETSTAAIQNYRDDSPIL